MTIDLRDASWQGTVRAPRLLKLLGLSTRQTHDGEILSRVIAADCLAGAAAVLAPALIGALYQFSFVPLVVALWPVALVQAGGYRQLHTRGVVGSVLVKAAGWVVVSCVLVGLFVSALDVRQSMRFTLLLLVATALGRAVVGRWLTYRRRKGELRFPVLARGRAADVSGLIAQVNRDRSQTMRVIAAQIIDQAQIAEFADIVLIPKSQDPVDAAVRNGGAAIALVGSTDLASEDLRRMIWRSEALGLDTLFLPIVEPVASPMVTALRGAGVPTFTFQGPNRRLFLLKVAMDRILAALGLIILAPVLAVVAVLVHATSPGPVLFRQARVGRHGRHFTFLKFRTMTQDAEAMRPGLEVMNTHAGGTLFKIRNDPRVTSVGRVLRRYSLDELPQLINVLRGDMSLVGPRPPLPEEVAKYPEDCRRRFVVRPGITGLWQVSGRSDLDPVESARIDTQYVENWSFLADLQILGRTARVVITGQGAY